MNPADLPPIRLSRPTNPSSGLAAEPSGIRAIQYSCEKYLKDGASEEMSVGVIPGCLCSKPDDMMVVMIKYSAG